MTAPLSGTEPLELLALQAAYPHLRRAILAEVVPTVVEMARVGDLSKIGARLDGWPHTPASILAALEKGE